MKLKRIYVMGLTVGIIAFVTTSCENSGIPGNDPEGVKSGDLSVSFSMPAAMGTKAYIETNKFTRGCVKTDASSFFHSCIASYLPFFYAAFFLVTW